MKSHPKNALGFACAFLACALPACDVGDHHIVPEFDDAGTPQPGEELGPCYTDGTCNGEMICGSGICVFFDAGRPLFDSGSICGDAGSQPTDAGHDSGPGDEGQSFDSGVPLPCASDYGCPDPRHPHCEPVLGRCVECVADSQCPGGMCAKSAFFCAYEDGGFSDAGADGGIGCHFKVTPVGTLNFGNISRGAWKTMHVSFENAGDAPCVITHISLGPMTGDWYSLPDLPALPLSVNPGEAAEVKVMCTAWGTGMAPNKMDIPDIYGQNVLITTTTDPNQPVAGINCTVDGWCHKLLCSAVNCLMKCSP